jgi:hypothetical protein
MAKKSLTPQALREVAETKWSDVGSGGTVSRTEQHAKQLFCALVAPLREQNAPDAEAKARAWTIGALVGAFPRMKRMDIRAKVQELVERVTTGKLTGKGQTQTAPLKVGDDVIIGCFYKHASGKNDKPINEWKSSIVRETPKRWVLQRGEQFDKKTNEPVPRDSMYTVRMRKAL